MVHACEEHGCDFHTVGLAAFLGLTGPWAVEGLRWRRRRTSKGGPPRFHRHPGAQSSGGRRVDVEFAASKRSRGRVWAFIVGVAASGPLGILLATFVLERTHLPNAAACSSTFPPARFSMSPRVTCCPKCTGARARKAVDSPLFLLGL